MSVGRDKHLLRVLGGMRAGLGRNRELEWAVGRECEGCVELGEVVASVDGSERGLRLRVTLRGHGSGQVAGWHRAGEEASGRALLKRHQGSGVERGPRADLAHIPPEVLGMRVPQGEGDVAYKAGRRVGGSEVVEHGSVVGQHRLLELDLRRNSGARLHGR